MKCIPLLPIFIASTSDLRVRLGDIFFLARSLSPDLDSTGKKNYRVRVEGKPRSYRTFLWSPGVGCCWRGSVVVGLSLGSVWGCQLAVGVGEREQLQQ